MGEYCPYNLVFCFFGWVFQAGSIQKPCLLPLGWPKANILLPLHWRILVSRGRASYGWKGDLAHAVPISFPFFLGVKRFQFQALWVAADFSSPLWVCQEWPASAAIKMSLGFHTLDVIGFVSTGITGRDSTVKNGDWMWLFVGFEHERLSIYVSISSFQGRIGLVLSPIGVILANKSLMICSKNHWWLSKHTSSFTMIPVHVHIG